MGPGIRPDIGQIIRPAVCIKGHYFPINTYCLAMWLLHWLDRLVYVWGAWSIVQSKSSEVLSDHRLSEFSEGPG